MDNKWNPPFFLFIAGRQKVTSRAYCNNTVRTPPPRRILVKHTLSGAGTLYANGVRHVLQPDSIFVIERPGPYKYCYEGNGEAWNFEYFSIVIKCAETILPQTMSDNPVMDISGHPELRSQIKELIEIRLCPEYQPEIKYSLLCYAFLMTYIAARFEDRKPFPPAVSEMLAVLDSNARLPVSINNICRKLKYTPEALIRLFKTSVGISPGRYHQNRRLTEVCGLLMNSKLNIKEIAQECGFESQNYLGRIFKQTMGLPPSEYRRNPNPTLLESIAKVPTTFR